MSRQTGYIILISLILASLLLLFAHNVALINRIHWKIYGALLRIECALRAAPSAINDMLLVIIDNETLQNMPQRWPYPRSDFVKVIENLKRAQAKLIAFDFAFLGKSIGPDDILLKTALEYNGKVILAMAINEEGMVDLATVSSLSEGIPSGIITKLQDRDGVTRRNLTYLVSEKEPNKGLLSWEMQILKAAKGINLHSLTSNGPTVTFKNDSGEEWVVPVNPKTKSFLINFRAYTANFPRISFYRVVTGNFDPLLVKDKIVLVGLLSSVLQDLHHTSLGWLPGITLNANAFLTLYAHDFIKDVPRYVEQLIVVIGVIIAAFFVSLLKLQKARILITLEIFLFLVLSYILLIHGYIWNYFLFPLAVVICPFLGKKIYLKINSPKTKIA